MQFSVEVKRLKEGTMYVCRGYLRQGKSSEYLFNLLTRRDQKVVIVDMAELSVEDSGLAVLALSWQFLTGSNRRLMLQNAPPGLVEDLLTRHGVAIAERHVD